LSEDDDEDDDEEGKSVEEREGDEDEAFETTSLSSSLGIVEEENGRKEGDGDLSSLRGSWPRREPKKLTIVSKDGRSAGNCLQHLWIISEMVRGTSAGIDGRNSSSRTACLMD